MSMFLLLLFIALAGSVDQVLLLATATEVQKSYLVHNTHLNSPGAAVPSSRMLQQRLPLSPSCCSRLGALGKQ
jgi:hypothetical protein